MAASWKDRPADEFLDAPTSLGLNPVTDRHRGDDDAQVRLDRLADVVVDRAGGRVVLGHPEGLLTRCATAGDLRR